MCVSVCVYLPEHFICNQITTKWNTNTRTHTCACFKRWKQANEVDSLLNWCNWKIGPFLWREKKKQLPERNRGSLNYSSVVFEFQQLMHVFRCICCSSFFCAFKQPWRIWKKNSSRVFDALKQNDFHQLTARDIQLSFLLKWSARTQKNSI